MTDHFTQPDVSTRILDGFRCSRTLKHITSTGRLMSTTQWRVPGPQWPTIWLNGDSVDSRAYWDNVMDIKSNFLNASEIGLQCAIVHVTVTSAEVVCCGFCDFCVLWVKSVGLVPSLLLIQFPHKLWHRIPGWGPPKLQFELLLLFFWCVCGGLDFDDFSSTMTNMFTGNQ